MNFLRGYQMIVHDPRLNDPGDKTATPPRPSSDLKPPASKVSWTVTLNHSPDAIIEYCASIARHYGYLDALYFMAHGQKGWLEMGSDILSTKNVDLFAKLNGYVKHIVFFSCLVGGELGDLAECSLDVRVYAQKVAEKSGAKVIACNIEQVYSWGKTKIIDFGGFEGDIFVNYPEGCFDMYNTEAGHPLMLEHLIFPADAEGQNQHNDDREGGGSGRGAN